MSARSNAPSILVVGVGNPCRGDDAVGPLVLEALRDRFTSESKQVDTKVLAGDLTDLVLLWRPDQDVVIID